MGVAQLRRHSLSRMRRTSTRRGGFCCGVLELKLKEEESILVGGSAGAELEHEKGIPMGKKTWCGVE